MKTKLLLIRHGETNWNKLGKFQGSIDIELTEEGKKQAKLLNNRLKDKFDFIYTSPLKRAKETAMILAQSSNKTLNIEEKMKEINFGSWEGLTIKEISEKYNNEFNNWKTDKLEGKIVGGELSLKNASLRGTNCVLDIVKRHKGQTVAVVAHGGIIKASLIGIFNWDMTMYHKSALGNTSITEIIFTDDLKPVLVKLNDTTHLDSLAEKIKYV
ncbi:MAG: histidine phosphatase family protein [Clostridium perfringens]|nr:histidine phosphatase family protein [Clostridium perfringens]